MLTDYDWVQECAYISRVTDKRGAVKEMGNSIDTFVRYCEMQRDAATKAGRYDSATYIQHCIDDLKEAKSSPWADTPDEHGF